MAHLYIWGDIYVNSGWDCFDENGNIYIYIQGDNLEVWGTIWGDGSPIDMEGTLYIPGGIVFAGGISGMEPMHQSQAQFPKILFILQVLIVWIKK